MALSRRFTLRYFTCLLLVLGLTAVFNTGSRCQEAARLAPDVRLQVRELLEQALKDFELVENARVKFQGLAQCAALYARLGDTDMSRKLFEQAREQVRQRSGGITHNDAVFFMRYYTQAGSVEEIKSLIDNPPPIQRGSTLSKEQAHDWLVRDAAIGLAKAGKDDAALELAKKVTQRKPEEMRDEVLQAKAIRLAEARDWKAVADTVAEISSPDVKIQTLAGRTIGNTSFDLSLPNNPGIAVIQDQQGNRPGALLSLQQALDLAREIKGPREAAAWANVLVVQARFGQIGEAQESLNHVPSSAPIYAQAVAAIAKAQAEAGQAKPAFDTIDKVQDNRGKIVGLAHVLIGLAHSGNTKAAQEAADKAVNIAKSMPQGRVIVAIDLIRAQAVAKDFEGAFRTAAAIPTGNDGFIYPAIAYWQGVYGDVPAALKTVADHARGGRGEDSSWVGNLEGIAEFQAQHGQAKEALAWVRQQAAPEVRAYGLVGVAKGMIEPAAAGAK
jgi:tetratricopeptide (TPR) repeat protein